jgi:hypothetical protein
MSQAESALSKKNMHLLFQSIGEAAAWDARSWDTPD